MKNTLTMTENTKLLTQLISLMMKTKSFENAIALLKWVLRPLDGKK